MEYAKESRRCDVLVGLRNEGLVIVECRYHSLWHAVRRILLASDAAQVVAAFQSIDFVHVFHDAHVAAFHVARKVANLDAVIVTAVNEQRKQYGLNPVHRQLTADIAHRPLHLLHKFLAESRVLSGLYHLLNGRQQGHSLTCSHLFHPLC